MRLDKYLSNMGIGTRSEVKGYIRKGRVTVNGDRADGPEQKVDEKSDQIAFDGQMVSFVEMQYFMLHKPAGVVTATEDKRDKTVLDLLESPIKHQLFPVGRLDKDTEGLLLITNDGALAHELLSPKKHVQKVYYARIAGRVTKEDVKVFSQGMDLGDFTTMPAQLEILTSGEESDIEVTICEGKFHQVKRMFEKVGKKVLYLKRISMGNLCLDEHLAAGEYRPLTEEEIVGNWDNTITTIPPYTLVSTPFKNWRGMQESGGRRVDKMIYLDMKSIEVCTPDMVDDIRKNIPLMKGYKASEMPTNSQLYRVYIEKYLRSHPIVAQNLDLIIAQRQPGQFGLPIEVYFFLTDKVWNEYETIQSDIFDHLIAMSSEFGLKMYQLSM